MAELQIDIANLQLEIAKTNQRLDGFKVAVQKRVLRKAIRAATNPVVKELRKEVKKVSKRTSRTIGQEVRTDKDTGQVTSEAGQIRSRATTRGATHLHLIDQATAPHEIQGVAFQGEDHFVSGTVSHPGTTGKDLVSRTQKSTKSKSLREFIKKADTEIIKEAAKLAAKAK